MRGAQGAGPREGVRFALLIGAALGTAWLAGAAATGQRYPGASLAWVLPAVFGAGLFGLGVVAFAYAASRLRHPAPLEVAERVTRPLWLSWALVLLLLLSTQANHYFANWPRLRFASLFAILVPTAAAGELSLLWLLERRYGLLTRARRRVGAHTLAFGGCLAIFIASAGGHLYTPDEWTIYAAAAGLVNHGVPAAYADEPYPLHLLGVIRSPSEQAEQMADQAVQRAYSKYGVVPSILAAPFYAVARVTGPGPQLPAQAFPYENRALPLVPLLLNPLLAAATAALLFQVARALGYRRHGALVATLAFACGSLAWPYSKTLLNMTPAGLFLLASFWCVLRTVRGMAGEAPHPDVAPASTGVVPSQVANTTREPAEAVANVPPSRAGKAGEGAQLPGPTAHRPAPGRGLGLLSAGAFAGLAIATRYEALLFAAPIAAWCGWPGREGLLAGRSLRRLARFTAGLAAVAVPLVLGLNLLRTGSPFDAGYGGEGTLASLAAKPWYGWFGILLSPGCGLVPHTPLMALGIVALAWFWEDARGPALVSGAVVLLAIAYYGSLTTTWCAFATWGPRYFVAVAPFMALPLAALWQRLAGAGRNPFVWLFGGGLLLWSAGTNLLAVLIDFNRGWQDHWAQGVTYLETSWVPFFSGITSHFRLFREWLLDGRGGLDLYLLYAAGPLGPVLVWCLIAAGVALLASVWIARESDESERT